MHSDIMHSSYKSLMGKRVCEDFERDYDAGHARDRMVVASEALHEL